MTKNKIIYKITKNTILQPANGIEFVISFAFLLYGIFLLVSGNLSIFVVTSIFEYVWTLKLYGFVLAATGLMNILATFFVKMPKRAKIKKITSSFFFMHWVIIAVEAYNVVTPLAFLWLPSAVLAIICAILYFRRWGEQLVSEYEVDHASRR